MTIPKREPKRRYTAKTDTPAEAKARAQRLAEAHAESDRYLDHLLASYVGEHRDQTR